ncbi:MAG: DUF6263 family protein [Patescibacteria group bacterium]
MAMKKYRGIIAVIAAAVCLVATIHAEDGSAALMLRLKPGLVFRQKEITEITFGGIPGSTPLFASKVGAAVSYCIRGVDAKGTATVEVTYLASLYRMPAFLGLAGEFDSTDPLAAAPQFIGSSAAMIGAGFSFRIKPNGEVIKVEGTEALIETILDRLGLQDVRMRAAMQSQLKRSLGANALKKAMRSWAIYPRKEVAVGDSWKVRRTLYANDMYFFSRDVFTLAARADDKVVLESRGSVRTQAADAGASGYFFNVSGEGVGTVVLDAATGWRVSSRYEMALKGRLQAQGRASLPEGLSAPLDMQVTVMLEPF